MLVTLDAQAHVTERRFAELAGASGDRPNVDAPFAYVLRTLYIILYNQHKIFILR